MEQPVRTPGDDHDEQAAPAPLPALRIGVAGGVVGILCCVGPTVLAAVGVVGAGTAYVWATDLYAGYAWWFRAAGVATAGGLVWHALRRRGRCDVDGVRSVKARLGVIAVSGVATYAALYALTTWLGNRAV